jgi:glycine amidinotransferase
MSIDEKIVCVEASEVHTLRQLESKGFSVVPVHLRNAYAFGGGLHCATADVCREGGMEDYFPWQEDDGSPF